MNTLIVLLLAVLGGKLDDPTPLSTKLNDPPVRSRIESASGLPDSEVRAWQPRSLSVALRGSEDAGRHVLDDPPVTSPTPKPQPRKEPVAPTPAPRAPTLWRLADRFGQRWEHDDPDWLMAWVARRNATVPVYQAVPVYEVPASYGSACAGGSCSSSSARGFRFFGR